jgi:membrane protease YdiL (CAAX protease family)
MLALGAFGTSIVAQVLVLLLNHQTGTTTLAQETPATLTRGALMVQSVLALLIGVVLHRSPTLRRRTLYRERISFGALLASLGLTLGIAPVANEIGVRVSDAVHVALDTSRWVTLIVQQATHGELIVLGLALTIVPACVEELLFRGLLMGALSGAHRLVQLGLPALLFGVFHGDWAQGAATFVLGLGFGFLRLTTRSLLIPIVAHATYNLLVLITMRSISDAQTETHQSIGVLAAGLGLAFSCAALLDRWHRRGPTATGVI